MCKSMEYDLTLAALTAMFYNLTALEMENHDLKHRKDDHLLLKHSHAYPHAGTFMNHGEHHQIQSHSIHLAHTHEFALVVDSLDDEIICDFRLNRDVMMIIEEKQALLIQYRDKIGLMIVDQDEVFQQLKEKIPPNHLLDYDAYRKEQGLA